MPARRRRHLQDRPALKRDAHALFEAALEAAEPARAVERAVRKLALGRGKIGAIAVGKAAPAMLAGIKRALGPRLGPAWVVCAGPMNAMARRSFGRNTRFLRGGHPLPDLRSVRAAREISRAAAGASGTWVLLVSGGASSLIASPIPSFTLKELRANFDRLLKSGAPIREVNRVRKKLTELGGGGLLERFAGDRLHTLALSDVPDDDPYTIGSAPGLPHRDRRGRARTGATVIAGARAALAAAAREARARGYRTIDLGPGIEGESRHVAQRQMRKAIALLRRYPRVCLISGGETTVTVRGRGLGGRNQEFVLAALLVAPRDARFTVFAAGTDGRDGPTRAAGAIADSRTLEKARRLGLGPAKSLTQNDSHGFFSRTGGLVVTGPTGTNVMDFRAILIERS